MLKRFLSLFVCFATIFSLCINSTASVAAICPQNLTQADNAVLVSETIQWITEDTYLVTSVYENPSSARGTNSTRSGSKYTTLKNNSGESLWTFTVHGTFNIVPGVSATCTNATHSYEIYSNSWKNASASSYRSGNSAYGNAEFIRKLLGITVETKDCSLVLSCDANGNLS